VQTDELVTIEDPVADALEAVAEAAETTARESRAIAEESRRVSAERAAGQTLRQAMAAGGPQRALGLAEQTTRRLLRTASQLRKALVHELTVEGAGVSAISRLFGVSHQRISMLLKRYEAAGADGTRTADGHPAGSLGSHAAPVGSRLGLRGLGVEGAGAVLPGSFE
jgi:hypothetical protein